MSLTEKQKHDLKKFIKELEEYRGRHTELVSVYVPAGYQLIKIIQHLQQEQGTAKNIKSTATRNNVIDALEKMVQHLRIVDRTPTNGLAAFAGNVAAREGQQDFMVKSIEPPMPLNMRDYRCDKEFRLDILRNMLNDTEIYGLVVMDRRDARIGILKGKSIINLVKTHSEVPGKFRAGGQCLVKDTLVQSCKGDIAQIDKSHNPQVLKSANLNDFSSLDSPITDRWDVKKSQVYSITTKYPRMSIDASKDHIFFVRSSQGVVEKSAEELKVGDFLIMPEKISVNSGIQTIKSLQYYNSYKINKEGRDALKQHRIDKNLEQKSFAHILGLTQTTLSSYETGKLNPTRGNLQKICAHLGIDFYEFLEKYTVPELRREIKLPVIIDEVLAQFVGYVTGDGCIEQDRITLFEQRKDVAYYLKSIFDAHFAVNSSIKYRESKNYYQIRYTSRPLVRLIVSEFPEVKKALDSQIPKKVLESPDRVLAAFLRGIFDAEGYVSGKRIGLGINNKMLAQQIQMSLLRFSVISSIHTYDNRRNKYSKNMRYTISISEKQSLLLFQECIGITSKEKAMKLQEITKLNKIKSNVRQILATGKQIRSKIEASGLNLELFPKVNNFFRDERMMSKEIFKSSVLANIKDNLLYNELLREYEKPFLPVKIAQISIKQQMVDMVDISVGNENFFANGLLVHNSAQRFARQREGAARDHYNKVGEYMKEQFLTMDSLKGILVGGPGPTKYDFVDGNHITNEVKKKIIAIKDLSYTDEYGLIELVEKSEDVLANEEVMKEKKIMAKFFDLLAKRPSMVAYGIKEVRDKVGLGVADTVLISEAMEENVIEEIEELAKKFSTQVQIISIETREGVQLKDIGRIAAILRYETFQ